MSWTFDKILRGARRCGASDIHLIRGISPAFRINGEVRLLEGDALEEEFLRGMIDGLLNERHREIFARDWQLCFSRHWPDVGRFRASVYLHAGVPEMAIRLCEVAIRPRDELGLPPIVDELARLPNGLILVTGATGNGKTTTLNYIVDLINRQRRAKIVTIEDPVEYVHHNQSSIIVQQEVLTDTPSFRQALTHVLRQDPDVIVIGEMRDLETVTTAMTAAETGHLVLATLHTPDVVQTIQRIFSVFPHEQQNNIMYQLANTLQAIVAQRLLPRTDGAGRILACEVCIATRRRAQTHPGGGAPPHLQRDADGPQAPDADDRRRAPGLLPARRDHVRRRDVERPGARDDPPAIGRERAMMVRAGHRVR